VIFFLIYSISIYFVIDLQRRSKNNETNLRLDALSNCLEKEGGYEIVHPNLKPLIKKLLRNPKFLKVKSFSGFGIEIET